MGVAIITYIWEPFMRDVRMAVPCTHMNTLAMACTSRVETNDDTHQTNVTPLLHQDVKHCLASHPKALIMLVDQEVEVLANRIAREYTERRLRSLQKDQLASVLEMRRKVKLNASTGMNNMKTEIPDACLHGHFL